jgi:glutamate/tyrosine decarboxylase-like PLP-dependent enzyme
VITLRHSIRYLVDKAWRDVVMLVEMVVDGCMGCLILFYVELDIRAANFKKVALSNSTFRAI